jgi:hypothetical protein
VVGRQQCPRSNPGSTRDGELFPEARRREGAVALELAREVRLVRETARVADLRR